MMPGDARIRKNLSGSKYWSSSNKFKAFMSSVYFFFSMSLKILNKEIVFIKKIYYPHQFESLLAFAGLPRWIHPRLTIPKDLFEFGMIPKVSI